jgi:hypothetical protein
MESVEIEESYRLPGRSDPYASAIDALNKVPTIYSPLEKINAFLTAQMAMKTEVVDHWSGKKCIETMDDEFPILIYITCRSTITHLVSEIRFL